MKRCQIAFLYFLGVYLLATPATAQSQVPCCICWGSREVEVGEEEWDVEHRLFCCSGDCEDPVCPEPEGWEIDAAGGELNPLCNHSSCPPPSPPVYYPNRRCQVQLVYCVSDGRAHLFTGTGTCYCEAFRDAQQQACSWATKYCMRLCCLKKQIVSGSCCCSCCQPAKPKPKCRIFGRFRR